MAGPTVLTADDVNLLVYRYLQESGALLSGHCMPVVCLHWSSAAPGAAALIGQISSAGFRHSAFTFGYESHVKKNGEDMPPGALVSFVQKGLQYMELEANLNEVRTLFVRASARQCISLQLLSVSVYAQDGTEVEADFSRLTAADLLSKSVEELKALARERRDGSGRDRERDAGKAGGRGAKPEGGEGRVKAEARRGDDEKGDAGAPDFSCVLIPVITDRPDNRVPSFAEPMDEDTAGEATVSPSDVTILEGHTSEVFICAWSPTSSLLASGYALFSLISTSCQRKRGS